ncbi:MAG: hypothetical protein AAFW46_13260 [Pseudomonadota bacterium]
MKCAWVVRAIAVAAFALNSQASAQETSCAEAAEACAAPAACLERLGAGSVAVEPDATASIDCDAAFAAYRDCLAAVAEQCGRPGGAPAAPEQEALARDAYQAAAGLDDPALLEQLADTYPNTFWAALARRRAGEIREAGVGPGRSPTQSSAASEAPAIDAGAAAGLVSKVYEKRSAEFCGSKLTVTAVWRRGDGAPRPRASVRFGETTATLAVGEVAQAGPDCGVTLRRTGRDPGFFAEFVETRP